MTTNFTSVSSLVLCGVDQGQGHDAAHGGPHVTERLEEGDELLRLRQVHGVGGKRCKVMQTMQSLTSLSLPTLSSLCWCYFDPADFT